MFVATEMVLFFNEIGIQIDLALVNKETNVVVKIEAVKVTSHGRARRHIQDAVYTCFKGLLTDVGTGELDVFTVDEAAFGRLKKGSAVPASMECTEVSSTTTSMTAITCVIVTFPPGLQSLLIHDLHATVS